MTWTRLRKPIFAVLIAGLIALSLWKALPVQKNIHLGLDLQGGVRVLLQLNPNSRVPAITKDVQGQVELVIQNRINGLGVSEPIITRSGSDRLLIELPAVKKPDEAIKLLKDVAVLEFKIVPPNIANRAYADKKYAADQNGAYKDSGPVVYTGAELKSAQAGYGPTGDPIILFSPKDAHKFAELTRTNMGKPLGIFLDKRFISAPTINGIISDSGEITGNFTQDETVRIANELNAGALPVSVTVIENDTIGPILGKIDLEKSLYASMLGLGLVLLFMLVMYRLPGLLADIALMIYVIMMLGMLAANKAVLTLPGIAGFVLSIGMAVDANVLIFERLKEEIWAGRTLRAAVKTGFARAFSAVFDSHFTTIVGAGVLFLLGTGTVKGFAYTLFWGTVFSLITAVFITRFFTDVIVDNDLITNPKAYGA